MDTLESTDSNVQESHIVRADEVDQTGTDILPVSDNQLMEEVAEKLRQEKDHVSPAELTQESTTAQSEILARRPGLRRDSAAPPPPLQPPPPAPMQQNSDVPTDSLSLAQLRKLVTDMPKVEQRAYSFEYADAESFVEEIDEWFQYNDFDRVMLMGMRSTFNRQWLQFCHHSSIQPPDLLWLHASEDIRRAFVAQALENIQNADVTTRLEALENICYLVTGVWGLTAGLTASEHFSPDPKTLADLPQSKSMQVHWIEQNVSLIEKCSGIAVLVKRLCQLLDRNRSPSGPDSDVNEFERLNPSDIPAAEREANLVLTILYFTVEVGRRQEFRDPECTIIRDAFSQSDDCLLVSIVGIIARLRWDETANIPLTRIILLLWKALLLIFGGSDQLKKAKDVLEPPMAPQDESVSRRGPFLHASPLDYHLFRQEITSKYPAYNPPPPVVPLELEHNSILPPPPQHPSRTHSSSGLFCGVGPPIAGGNGSIFQQAVHIATPAPSPPPSPIGPGGKAGKKQNYQTNQNFPLMYPPLDDSSNRIGGKGSTERQDVLVEKRWEGSDVPASIIEAGQLFSSHVKMTRAMQQLWEERENFMRYDRGWSFDQSQNISGASFPDDLDIDQMNLSNQDRPEPKAAKKETDDPDVQRRLDSVEKFYAKTLAHLQSLTIVFLKIILTNVSAMANQAARNMGNDHSTNGSSESFDLSVEDLDNIRLREITSKAVSGTLLLLVKWFKRSHILKFEYMTQLLLDSNYLPLILKMFAHQDVDLVVAQKNDREELSFFHFCADHNDMAGTESEDEAVPPPIFRQRPRKISDGRTEDMMDPILPEVDELGYPTAPLPKEPITEFSFRNFFSVINYLHIMQKITHNKSHRCLLLVQYKSSTILRKGLKIPDPHLRYYTLKLFKSQVPYCGRKWRQGNMRVITAIYLYCQPELRDDWLAGMDIDAEVDEALPLEQALRGLTHWWHLRQYKDVMVGPYGTSMMEEERDFFVRELESMGWGVPEDLPVEESDLTNQGTEWDGALQMEGYA